MTKEFIIWKLLLVFFFPVDTPLTIFFSVGCNEMSGFTFTEGYMPSLSIFRALEGELSSIMSAAPNSPSRLFLTDVAKE